MEWPAYGRHVKILGMILSEDEILKLERAIPAVYKITNLANGKIYVGSTTNYRVRRVQHFSELRCGRHSNSHLQRAFNKYGESQFKMEMLTPVTPDELDLMESGFIEWLNATNPSVGYNVLKGGGRRPSKPWGQSHLSEESRQRISKAKLGRKYSDQARENMSKGQKLLYASGYVNPQKGRATPEAIAALKKPVIHFDAQDLIIGEYDSIKEAQASTRWSLWLITKSAKKNLKLQDGSYWRFKVK